MPTRKKPGSPSRAPRDIQRTYSRGQFAAKLRRLAAAIENGRAFTIRVGGEALRIPAGTAFSIEHERGEDGSGELEFQLTWVGEPVPRRKGRSGARG